MPARIPHRPRDVAVGRPRSLDRLLRVVEEVDVARQARRTQQLVERHAAGHVALAGQHALIG
jgi:hypothetical protein